MTVNEIPPKSSGGESSDPALAKAGIHRLDFLEMRWTRDDGQRALGAASWWRVAKSP